MKKTAAGIIVFILAALAFWGAKPDLAQEWASKVGVDLPSPPALTTDGSNQPAGTAVTTAAGDQSVFYAGMPVADGYPNPVTVIERNGFTLAYDEERANPAWVGYKITLNKWHEEHARPSGFKVDDDTRAKISHKDYTRSGYDRGHMAPNEAISESYGRHAQLDTFLMSNVVPQKGNLNQGPWREFEERMVEYTKKAEEVWVITGPLYDDDVEMMPNGEVEIPDAFFKIAVDEFDGRARIIGIIMSQGLARKADPYDHITTVDEIEAASGWDFFAELPDDAEAAIEEVRAEGW
jgi:endonuclease G